MFRFAGGTGVMGEAGPEAIVPLRRGPDGSLGVGATESQVNVNIRNYGAQVTATKSTDSQGRPSIDIEVRRMVQDLGERLLSDRGSPWHRALSRTIGSNPATTVG